MQVFHPALTSCPACPALPAPPALAQGIVGDPRRPDEAVSHARLFADAEPPQPDGKILVGSVFGMAALLLKARRRAQRGAAGRTAAAAARRLLPALALTLLLFGPLVTCLSAPHTLSPLSSPLPPRLPLCPSHAAAQHKHIGWLAVFTVLSSLCTLRKGGADFKQIITSITCVEGEEAHLRPRAARRRVPPPNSPPPCLAAWLPACLPPCSALTSFRHFLSLLPSVLARARRFAVLGLVSSYLLPAAALRQRAEG